MSMVDTPMKLLSEFRTDKRKMLLLLAISALGNVLIIATVNMALHRDDDDGSSFGLALFFILAIVIYVTAQKRVMSDAARTAEEMIARLRRRIMASVRTADAAAMQLIGRAPIYAAVTREAQTISNTLPLMVVGAQQTVLLIFMSFYIIYLSKVAFVMIGLFGICAVSFHVIRLRRLQEGTDAQIANQNRFFETFRGMLGGVKEMSFHAERRDDVVADVIEQSEINRQMASDIKKVWAREFVTVQALFYVMLGLMVFVVPMFTETYHDVVVQVTVASLFMIGPLSSLAQAIPAVTDTMRALRNIRALEARLQDVTDGRDISSEDAAEIETEGHALSLEAVTYSFRDAAGTVTFGLEPVSAAFRSGEIAFITGGNGSGKSTLFRLLTGIAQPEDGQVLLDGVPLQPDQYAAYRDRIGVVFADFYLFRRLHGLEHVDPARVVELLERFELTGKTELVDGVFSTTDLSAGQRKRLALIIVILQDTPVIMLDEWAADQDPQFRATFYREILPELASQGRIVICITHDEAYFDVAKTLYAMADGHLTKMRGT